MAMLKLVSTVPPLMTPGVAESAAPTQPPLASGIMRITLPSLYMDPPPRLTV